MEYDWFPVSDMIRDRLLGLCPPNEYRVLDGDEFPEGLLPTALTRQYNSIFVMASGTINGCVVYMLNGNRVHQKDRHLDQQPFGLVLTTNGTLPSGCLIQHGTWSNRTSNPPHELWYHIQSSGLGARYPISELPEKPAGQLLELKIESQEGAFSALLAGLRSKFEI